MCVFYFYQEGHVDELIAEIKLAKQKREDGLGFFDSEKKSMVFLYETFIMLG